MSVRGKAAGGGGRTGEPGWTWPEEHEQIDGSEYGAERFKPAMRMFIVGFCRPDRAPGNERLMWALFDATFRRLRQADDGRRGGKRSHKARRKRVVIWDQELSRAYGVPRATFWRNYTLFKKATAIDMPNDPVEALALGYVQRDRVRARKGSAEPVMGALPMAKAIAAGLNGKVPAHLVKTLGTDRATLFRKVAAVKVLANRWWGLRIIPVLTVLQARDERRKTKGPKGRFVGDAVPFVA